MNNIKVIGFDADDTLWVNETHFQNTEKRFCEILKEFSDEKTISEELFKTEIQNLSLFGFGAKGFILSMIETSLRISNNKINPHIIEEIIQLGKKLLDIEIELLPGVKEILEYCKPKYKLVLVTKGDLLDQERKLKKSGLESYFHHVEILSNKEEKDYLDLLKHLEIKPEEFVMTGNSLKSDIIPALNIGCYGIHIPFNVTWQHEKVEEAGIENNKFYEFDSLLKLKELL